ncbi:hypothetical protein [Bacteriovorax sp. DB6_IX]|uniref:hypothetical protein n=1 Tax=Bacteriovorax sp. DB6_IX TaxID=1353530 RepID=UPI000429FFA5|nr:hypothetical protein [Bacteriovorax sp. DB6_IX]
MRKILGLVLCLLTLNVAANDQFFERYEFVREDGKLIAVRDKSLSRSFKISNYVKYIKEQILTEQALIQQEGVNYDEQMRDLLYDDANSIRRRNRADRNKENIVLSMKELGNIDFIEVFEHPAFNDVLAKFESKLKEAFFYIDPQLIAKPDNASFFYKRAVTHQVVSWALNYARKKLSTIPLLNTASYAIVQIEHMMTKRRLYHQNNLLTYLELNTADELGLTKEEADSIFSSIYESRIPWYAFWESSRAKLNWARYGSSQFYAGFRVGSNKLRGFKHLYTSIGERYSYAFQEVEFNGERVIVNLFDKNNMFDSKPAIAYNFDRPKKIRRLRSVLTLARLGLSFVSLPAFIKDTANDYIKSYYETQQITEGALLTNFLMKGNTEAARNLRLQYINAFDLE